MNTVTYDSALLDFCETLLGEGEIELAQNGCFVRDSKGRLKLLVVGPSDGKSLQDISKKVHERLGAYSADLLESVVRVHEDAEQANVGVALPESLQLSNGNVVQVRVIDKRLGGQDWLQRPTESGDSQTNSMVFWSLKGGVGRTTALAVLASELSRRSHNVLILDLDLEAPGVGEQLLANDQKPEFGVLDYLVEDAIGSRAVTEVLGDIVAASTLGEGAGLIHVCPAVGKRSIENPEGYVGKLFRSYFPAGDRLLSERVRTLIGLLCERNRYDAVLIDARAGINEATAAAIIGLDADVLLFGHDTPQTFAGYRYALAHLSRFVEAGNSEWRLKMKMVHAKSSADPVKQSSFRDSAFELFSEWIYDDVGDFSFGMNDVEAPHHAWVVLDDSNFHDFDPVSSPSLLSAPLTQSTFGSFVVAAIERLRLA